MKRTFRKAIACILAVLMVITAAPLSALAFEPIDGKNVGWWGDSNFDATKNDALYDLVNSNGSPIEPEFETIVKEFEFAWADAYTVADTEVEDPEADLLDQMKPTITVTVTNMGNSVAGDFTTETGVTSTTRKYFYGETFKTIAQQPTEGVGSILNPADLKAGQRIAVTFEMGGVDANYASQLKGMVDTDYLVFGAYSATRKWATYTTGNNAAPFVGNFYSNYGDAASNGGSQMCVCDAGQFYTPFVSNTPVPQSAYTGPEVRTAGEHGMLVCSIEFEVKQDCDLSDVLWLDRDKDGSATFLCTSIIPYDEDAAGGYFTFDTEDQLHTAGLIALNYTNYSKGSEPQTTQYTVTFEDYAGNVVSSTAYDENTAAADVTVPANTASDAQYTYAWPTVADVTADVTYKETRTTNNYTVTFVNAAGQTVSETSYPYGTAAADVTVPENTATDVGEQVTTTYSWPTVADVTGDATYTETSATTATEYTVTFTDYAGAVVSTQTLAYGATPVAPANTASDAQYTYAWPTVADVTGDANYTETRTVNHYTVTWKFADDRDDLVDDYAYGQALTVPANSSVKVGNVTTTYKWENLVDPVTGDATYTEVVDQQITDAYTITFVDYAGNTVSSQAYEAGTEAAAVTVPANTASDAQYTYAWPAVADVTGDATYNETRTVNEYTITFVNAAGQTVSEQTVEYGGSATIPENTADTAQYAYAWPEVVAVTGDAVYNEIQEVRNYTVKFVNYAGETVAEDIYEYGETPVAPANTAADAQYTYAWPTVADVTGDATYNEVATTKEYTVTFVNAAGQTVLENTYEYGTAAGEVAVPDNTGNTKRTMYSWPEIADVTADATYNEVVTDLGYAITVNGSDLAQSITVNGEVVGDGKTVNVPSDSTVTLVATPVDGATFVGWKNGNGTVSTNATFNTVVVADAVYTPVFELDTVGQFTVVFVDKFGNVVDAQTVAKGADVVVPAAPTLSGYVAGTDNGWSLTNDEIAALDAATIVKAVYAVDESAAGYTVTADGATITYKEETKDNEFGGLPYDAQVTLTAPNATAWMVNDVVVAYGESYTFYVGADVTVTYATNAVDQTPSITGVSVGQVGNPGAVKGTFLASFNMTDDCKFVKAGYIFGLGATDASTLDDVDGTTVKARYFAETPNQFQLNYGFSSQTGTVTAIAFLVYKDAANQTQVIYAAPQHYTYA